MSNQPATPENDRIDKILFDLCDISYVDFIDQKAANDFADRKDIERKEARQAIEQLLIEARQDEVKNTDTKIVLDKDIDSYILYLTFHGKLYQTRITELQTQLNNKEDQILTMSNKIKKYFTDPKRKHIAEAIYGDNIPKWWAGSVAEDDLLTVIKEIAESREWNHAH